MQIKTNTIRVNQFFSPDSISLDLQATHRDEILEELVSLLKLDSGPRVRVFELLKKREDIASTAIGCGVAIPHCRTSQLSRLRAAYAHSPNGVEFRAIDEKPVYDFILIVAPPLEVSEEYLPVLGRIAQILKEPDMPARLASLKTPQQFTALMDEMSE